MYDVLVCDPDQKQYEGNALGLLYTAVSLATTLGNDDGTGSAIYFTGSAFKASRIRNLTFKEDGKEFEPSIKRRQWVKHINRQTAATSTRFADMLQRRSFLLGWATQATYSYDRLYNHIQDYKITLRNHQERDNLQ